MSEKITHVQARESLNDLVAEWRHDGTLGQYINQQEKQEKLLKLYQKYFNDYDDLSLEEETDIYTQIKELENAK